MHYKYLVSYGIVSALRVDWLRRGRIPKMASLIDMQSTLMPLTVIERTTNGLMSLMINRTDVG